MPFVGVADLLPNKNWVAKYTSTSLKIKFFQSNCDKNEKERALIRSVPHVRLVGLPVRLAVAWLKQ